jgi:hypothetical protein
MLLSRGRLSTSALGGSSELGPLFGELALCLRCNIGIQEGQLWSLVLLKPPCGVEKSLLRTVLKRQ